MMAVTAAVVARLGHVEDTLGLLEVGGKKAMLPATRALVASLNERAHVWWRWPRERVSWGACRIGVRPGQDCGLRRYRPEGP
ncbi:hypothetical protein BIV25_21400 [Streptomyces sp. MUSC 14]|nr:hypothetical protein BIV25_21400 [Streptomyces sp. MUSC 14]